jgi:hypothetical protein
MSIEDGSPHDLILEDASADEEELCPACESMRWLRLIAAYTRGACYVVYCGDCGKPSDARWTILP